MYELFTETQVFLGKLSEQVADDPAVVRTDGRTHIQYALYIQKHSRNRCFGYHAHIQHRTGCTGIGGGKALPRPRL